MTLNSTEMLISPSDMEDPGTGPPTSTHVGEWSIETNSAMKLDFGKGDTLTLQGAGVFQAPSTPVVFSTYKALMTVLKGTGRFKDVNGVILINGPFMVWFEKPDAPPQGRYTGELSGTLCW